MNILLCLSDRVKVYTNEGPFGYIVFSFLCKYMAFTGQKAQQFSVLIGQNVHCTGWVRWVIYFGLCSVKFKDLITRDFSTRKLSKRKMTRHTVSSTKLIVSLKISHLERLIVMVKMVQKFQSGAVMITLESVIILASYRLSSKFFILLMFLVWLPLQFSFMYRGTNSWSWIQVTLDKCTQISGTNNHDSM